MGGRPVFPFYTTLSRISYPGDHHNATDFSAPLYSPEKMVADQMNRDGRIEAHLFRFFSLLTFKLKLYKINLSQ